MKQIKRQKTKGSYPKWISAAFKKAKPEEIKISWDGYYPMCPGCGSWEVERRYRSGEIWPYCPNCGQKLKDLKTEPEKVLPERWHSIIMEKFSKRS